MQLFPFNSADLQFSSEEEGDDMPLSEGDPDAMPDDDSQQAAEAMVQLGNIGYYPPASGVTIEQGSLSNQLVLQFFAPLEVIFRFVKHVLDQHYHECMNWEKRFCLPHEAKCNIDPVHLKFIIK